MFKKIIGFVVILVMVFSLGACNFDNELSEYKKTAKEHIDNHVSIKVQSDYTESNWNVILQSATNGKAAINVAIDKASVDSAVKFAKDTIDEVLPNKIIDEVLPNDTIDEPLPSEKEIGEVVSIHFYTTENWVHWQDHKFYDFVDMTYSTKRSLVEYVNGEPVTATPEDYEVIATFTEQQLNAFFESIREIGLFDLDENYYDYVFDADSWNLVITFADGTTFESEGYAAYPEQKEEINEVFMALTGYVLF